MSKNVSGLTNAFEKDDDDDSNERLSAVSSIASRFESATASTTGPVAAKISSLADRFANTTTSASPVIPSKNKSVKKHVTNNLNKSREHQKEEHQQPVKYATFADAAKTFGAKSEQEKDAETSFDSAKNRFKDGERLYTEKESKVAATAQRFGKQVVHDLPPPSSSAPPAATQPPAEIKVAPKVQKAASVFEGSAQNDEDMLKGDKESIKRRFEGAAKMFGGGV